MNIMVILKNVKRTDNIIECDYFPENGTSFGHVALDINKQDFVESKCIMADEDVNTRFYYNHAASKLMKISKTDDFKNNNFKSEYMVAWY